MVFLCSNLFCDRFSEMPQQENKNLILMQARPFWEGNHVVDL